MLHFTIWLPKCCKFDCGISNENKTDVYLHNSLEFNFINWITWTKAGPAAPKKAMFLRAVNSSAPPKNDKFRLVDGSSASSISFRCPEIVLLSSGPDSWNCLSPARRVTLVLLLASFLSRASRSNFFFVNLIITENQYKIFIKKIIKVSKFLIPVTWC